MTFHGSWANAVRAAAFTSSLVQVVRGSLHVDREAIAIGLLLGIAAGLTLLPPPRLARVGWLGVAGLFLNQTAWMVGATISLTSAAPSVAGAAVPAFLAVAGLFGLGSSVARLRNAAPGAVTPLGVAAVAMILALAVAVPLAGADGVGARPGDLRVTTRDVAFEPSQLAANAGEVAVVVHNNDLFWHTFTLNATNANLNVPTGGTKRLVLGGLAPGRYEFVCAIPGHEGAGMKGVLVVR